MQERRVSRSPSRDRALGKWLEAVANRSGLSDLVIADRQGLLVATADRSREPAELAAYAARHVPAKNGELNAVDEVGRTTAVLGIRWRDTRLFVCARGERRDVCRGLDDAIPGVTRILA